MGIGLVRFDERGDNIGPAVYGRTEHADDPLADDVIGITAQHGQRERNDIVFPRSTAALLAPVTSERVRGPRPHLGINVAKVLDQIGNARGVHVVIQDHAAADSNLRVVVVKAAA